MRTKSSSRIEALEKEGWVKQFVANEPRLSEAASLYEELGFEVHLEPLPKGQECTTCSGTEGHEAKGECRVCFEGFEDQYRIIFTRLRQDPNPPEGKGLG
jgi:hypothetical protein